MSLDRDRRARIAVAGAYFVQGLCFAALVTRVPAIQAEHRFTDEELSLVLLAVPVFAGIGSALSGWLAARFGSAALLRVSGPLVCATIAATGAAPNRAVLFAVLVVFGLGVGAVDATMNMQGVAVQARYGRSILASMHAVWSVAGILGALASVAVAGRIPLAVHLGVVGAVGVALALLVGPGLLKRAELRGRRTGEATAASVAGTTDSAVPVAEGAAGAAGTTGGAGTSGGTGGAGPATGAVGAGTATGAIGATVGATEPGVGAATGPVGLAAKVPWKPVLMIGIAMMFMYIADSSTSNWHGPYLLKELGSTESVAPWAYFFYQGFQVIGRSGADRLGERFGPVRTVAVGALVGTVGLALVVAAQSPWWGIAGFGVLGLGLCAIVPQSFTAAARLDPDDTGVAIARVNLFNYAGFVLGAPLVGLVGNLRLGFVIPLVLVLAIIPFAGAFRPTFTRGAGRPLVTK
ncbi:MFS transporter [Longispora sp. NPDC051575]|uniref:MFS transporter n=1 Tax=Longispora sp. NPDC051575 TaxID=3154943 RepID=UPI003426B145